MKEGDILGCYEPLVRVEENNGRVHIYSLKGLDDKDAQMAFFAKHGCDIDNLKRVDRIPCGRCDGCQAAHAKRWADRLMLENSLHENSWFVTLTFDDEHIWRQCIGCYAEGLYSVHKDHVQKFMKNLRHRQEGKIAWYNEKTGRINHQRVNGFPLRFFACGEYGGKSLRPHYHLIIFGLDLPEDDLTFLRNNDLGQPYYTSKLISEVWPYGYNVVAKVEYNSCAYVARYCVKKLRGQDKLLYEHYGMEEPFILMSRNPGIGYWWSIQNPGWVNHNQVYLETEDGSVSMLPPKYFERRLERYDIDSFEKRKMQRKVWRQYDRDAQLFKTDRSEYGYVKVVESNLKKSLDILTNLRSQV